MKPTELWRWLVILLFGGLGIYCLGSGLWSAVQQPTPGWNDVLFEGSLALLFAAPPLTMAFLAYRRRYRSLATVGTWVGTLAVFTAVSGLNRFMGRDPHLWRDDGQGFPWRQELWLVLGVLPLVTGGLFYLWCRKTVDRQWPEPTPTAEEEARDLRWVQRLQPVRRGMLKAKLVTAEVLVWAAALAFAGTLLRLVLASGVVSGFEAQTIDPMPWVLTMAASLVVFLLSWIGRIELGERWREMSATDEDQQAAGAAAGRV